MLKLSDKAICKPLHMIFTSCLETGLFPIYWKKANFVPIHKKESKQLAKNYKPVSLLPICGKVFEHLIYNEVYPYLIDNILITSHQSGFKASHSCINQLLSITHEIYRSFDEGFKSWEYFQIYPRHSIGGSMTVLYLNFRKMASLVN